MIEQLEEIQEISRVESQGRHAAEIWTSHGCYKD